VPGRSVLPTSAIFLPSDTMIPRGKWSDGYSCMCMCGGGHVHAHVVVDVHAMGKGDQESVLVRGTMMSEDMMNYQQIKFAMKSAEM
jgi:hypothetical protein